MNFIDRVVNYVSPVSGVKRLRARANIFGFNKYDGASRVKRAFKNWKTSSGDADLDINLDLPLLRERSRDLVRNNPLALGAINTKVTSIVGTGLRVKSQIDHEFLGITEDQANDFQNAAELHFKLWGESKECDNNRVLNFAELQALAIRAVFTDGDVFVNLPYFSRPGSVYDRKIQLIESDFVSNPERQPDNEKISCGIERDNNGAPYKIHVSNKHPGATYKSGPLKWQSRLMYDSAGHPRILHVHKPIRIGQTRGVPDLAPVIEPLKQLGRYTEAELMAAVVSGMFTVFITTPDGDSSLDINFPENNNSNNVNEVDYNLGNGSVVGLADGETISTANPGRPNDKFDPFVLAILRQIGVALELPYEILIKHFTASYSASRAAILEVWRYYKARRKWFASQFCQPIYELVVSECVAKGLISAPGFFNNETVRKVYLMTVWSGDAPGQLDPLKETNAAIARIGGNLSTESRETTELTGSDWRLDEKQRQRERKNRVNKVNKVGGDDEFNNERDD